jgi:hypothetical protein
VQSFPLRHFPATVLIFVPSAAAEYLNQHSEAIKLKLDNDFEDWDFFADDFDNRVISLPIFLLPLLRRLSSSLLRSSNAFSSRAKVRD